MSLVAQTPCSRTVRFSRVLLARRNPKPSAQSEPRMLLVSLSIAALARETADEIWRVQLEAPHVQADLVQVRLVDRQIWVLSDRDGLVLDRWAPDGSHLDSTWDEAEIARLARTHGLHYFGTAAAADFHDTRPALREPLPDGTVAVMLQSSQEFDAHIETDSFGYYVHYSEVGPATVAIWDPTAAIAESERRLTSEPLRGAAVDARAQRIAFATDHAVSWLDLGSREGESRRVRRQDRIVSIDVTKSGVVWVGADRATWWHGEDVRRVSIPDARWIDVADDATAVIGAHDSVYLWTRGRRPRLVATTGPIVGLAAASNGAVALDDSGTLWAIRWEAREQSASEPDDSRAEPR
jgi:hypothetical protein